METAGGKAEIAEALRYFEVLTFEIDPLPVDTECCCLYLPCRVPTTSVASRVTTVLHRPGCLSVANNIDLTAVASGGALL